MDDRVRCTVCGEPVRDPVWVRFGDDTLSHKGDRLTPFPIHRSHYDDAAELRVQERVGPAGEDGLPGLETRTITRYVQVDPSESEAA
jgi:hypothetical protein